MSSSTFETGKDQIKRWAQRFKLSPDHTRVSLVSVSSNSTIVQAWWPSNYTNNEDFQRAVDQLTHKRKLTRNETALFLVKEILEEARAWVAKIAIIITPKYVTSILKRVCEKAGTCSEYFVLFYLLIIIKARLFWPLSIFSIFSVFVFSCLRFCTFCT